MSYCENESYTKLKNKIIMKNAKYSINANLVYKNGYSGKNVNIAVLDTGVFKHKQLDGCIKHFMDFVVMTITGMVHMCAVYYRLQI